MIAGLVSTIIPVYNRPQMVLKAVQSVLEQSWRPIEVILVDDGSTDATPAVLDELAARHPTEVRVIHKANGGPGLAREAGRLAACGEFIQYLDSDDWLLPNKFADQVQALRLHPECGIAYGITRLVDDNGRVLVEPSKDTGVVREQLFPALLVDRWWHTHTPLYTRAVSDLAGAWPKQRPEDWDLEARMAASGVRLVHCGSVVSCHRHHDSTDRVTSGNALAYLRDEAWFLPRLHACALQAGMQGTTPEMQHLARWIFLTARRLAAAGEIDPANSLLHLLEHPALQLPPLQRLASRLARVLGWRCMQPVFAAWLALTGRSA